MTKGRRRKMVNKTIIQGRLTATPSIRYTTNNVAMLEFTVAWSEKYKETERKLFLRCKAWRSTAEFIDKYFFKGSPILITGELGTEEWEKDGKKNSRTVLNVEKVDFCGGNKSDGESKQEQPQEETGFMNIPEGIEDELPFK